MSRLLLPFADQQIEIPSLMPGNIALTVGLKQVVENTDSVRKFCFASVLSTSVVSQICA